MRNFLRFFALLIVISLVGCGASIPTIKPYKMDIQQGNVVTSEMLLKLRPGMTKSQVQFIMGTPLLVDSFHTNRWDYFYQLRKQGKIVSQRRVILDFENDLLTRVRGDVVPKGATAEDVAKQVEAEAGAIEKKSGADEPVDNTDDASAEPVIVPIEAPDVESVDAVPEAVAPVSGLEGNEPASVLAVPIPLEPSGLAPEQKAEIDGLQPSEVPSKETIEGEVSSIGAPMNTLAPAAGDPATSLDASTVEVAPEVNLDADIPAESSKILPASTYEDSKRVFRLDRELDMQHIKPDEISALDETPLQESVVQEVKENQSESLLNQEEPSFFERMLEKIGF
jgi:outer membrane protein assembly factor BamE